MNMETLDDRVSYWVGYALMEIGRGHGLRNAFALALKPEASVVSEGAAG